MTKDDLSISKIKKLLEFQKEDFPDLHQAAENESIILFLGAGVSKLYGCCLWKEMAQRLTNKLRQSEIIDYAEKDILDTESNSDPRKVLTICHELCIINNHSLIYEEEIKNALKITELKNYEEVYTKIFSIKALAHLTTNLDLGIDNFINLPNKKKTNIRIYDCTLDDHKEIIKQLNYNVLKDGNVFHLHGTLNNINYSILPVDQYLKHYDENNTFLNELFLRIKSTSCVLIFIGFSLNEWDIIEKIFKLKNYPKEINSILLSPIFEYQITKFNLEMSYYKSFGVQPVAYFIDKRGYEELLFVLDNLSNALDQSIPNSYETYLEIEKV